MGGGGGGGGGKRERKRKKKKRRRAKSPITSIICHGPDFSYSFPVHSFPLPIFEEVRGLTSYS